MNVNLLVNKLTQARTAYQNAVDLCAFIDANVDPNVLPSNAMAFITSDTAISKARGLVAQQALIASAKAKLTQAEIDAIFNS